MFSDAIKMRHMYSTQRAQDNGVEIRYTEKYKQFDFILFGLLVVNDYGGR
jgi:hypothetical protein